MNTRSIRFKIEYTDMLTFGCIVSDSARNNRRTRKKLIIHANGSYDDLRMAYDFPIIGLSNDNKKIIFSERRYHTFSHVLDCIDCLREHKELLRVSEEAYQKLFMAISWHDSIYKTHSNDTQSSESLSADRFAKDFNSGFYGYSFINSVKELIRKTDHFNTTSDGGYLNGIIRDIDLAGLGGSWKQFCFNSQLIRMEYSNSPDYEFIPGRIHFCETMLKRNHIYEMTLLREVFEERARENLERELERLKKQKKEMHDTNKN